LAAEALCYFRSITPKDVTASGIIRGLSIATPKLNWQCSLSAAAGVIITIESVHHFASTSNDAAIGKAQSLCFSTPTVKLYCLLPAKNIYRFLIPHSHSVHEADEADEAHG
jgi:hypothetical protein